MAYKALYRTYRPQNFDEVAGQEHITRTFRNALKGDKIAHAYLFSGPRGTGKTSIAKIIAKAVNCLEAPSENPCNVCENCVGISNNSISDVIEIDAASNNGVDEIREIRDKVKYLPGVGRYKVYIIDEVHMLSTGAFNALLKTLEEPPKHVIFILATTEPHKIPATIHSRCQRFDFRGISIDEMISKMKEIVKSENISIDDESLSAIAESAEGGMRDALSLLDQVISYCESDIKVEDVHVIKGTVSNEKILKIANFVYEKNAVEAINQLDNLLILGKEPPRICANMIQFYRDLLVYKNVGNKEFTRTIFANEEFIKLARLLSNNIIFFYIDILNKTQNDMRWSNNTKLYLELAFIKMSDTDEQKEILFLDKISELENKIIKLESNLNRKTVQEVKSQVPVKSADKLINIEKNSPSSEEKSVLDNGMSKVEIEDNINHTSKDEKIDSKEKVNDIIKEDTEDLSKTYNISFLEDVLNNGNRDIKLKMIKMWDDIKKNKPSNLIQYSNMLHEGKLVATNGEKMIITYDNATVCNRMMKKDNIKKIKEVIKSTFNQEIEYMALPTEVWEEKSQEFISLWKQGKKNIKLTKIFHKELRDMSTIFEVKEAATPKIVEEAINLFEDLVNIKE